MFVWNWRVEVILYILEKLIDLHTAGGPDYVTENMIEFKKDDIIGTYNMSKGMFLYMDFVENEKV